MPKFTPVLYCLLLALAVSCNQTRYDVPPRILIFSKTAGFRHASIPVAVKAVQDLCAQNGILAEATEEAAVFNEPNLKRYAAVIFLSTTGDVLDQYQENAFERYIQAGGGFVGIHAATDTEYGWGWFTGLVGAQFESHPEIQSANLLVKNHQHPSTRHLPNETWNRKDEWYNFKKINPNTQVLLTIDESSYQGGKNGEHHPMCWHHTYDGGRAWYTAGGHTEEAYAEPDFLQHLLGGITYAIGKNKRLQYEKCRTPELPDPTRFTKTVLAEDLTEPMEIDLFPDGKIILIERRGAIKLFDPSSGQLTLVHKLPVHSLEEDGLMGCAVDPQYASNHWIYLYYSAPEKSVNRLSRFTFIGDSLDRASEKMILEVAVQREECCHTGGSIEFDEKGLLYLSTGDNTNPFESDGYSPSDERPGRSAWDAQKSSANTMDLRGKILRIQVHEDGSYSCPKDNLFTGESGLVGRPEIYVMGCRNPFRISIDSRRNLLFWGEVGPDAGEPDTARGPQGHDEVNRAKKAGFFGWPYFVGNNKPYREYDFAARKSGAPYNPEAPFNNSPFNTGSQQLPPAQPAFIWYPYANSTEFPLVRNGGRNAMAGPVYYCDRYPAETRFPDYYNGKLITYDWMRNWMMAITIDSLGDFSKMETFGDSVSLSRPMDMVIDKKGVLWVLEYGTQWFSKNPDARLSKIEYHRGNRPPTPDLKLDKSAGAVPCTIRFDFSGTKDYDQDPLVFRIDFGDGSQKQFEATRFRSSTALPDSLRTDRTERFGFLRHTYHTAGTYEVQLTVEDGKSGFRTIKRTVHIGNEPPSVVWDLGNHNRSFYQPGTVLPYRILVNDAEDGSSQNGRIQDHQISANIDFLEQGFDMTLIAQGHQSAKQVTAHARGKALIDKSDCKTCHAIDRKINGPAYQSIAERYRKNEFAVRSLTQKIIKGGSGVWGSTVMSAHPQISEEDAAEMIQWILSLGDPPKPRQNIPAAGTYVLSPPAHPESGKKTWPGTYILRASYRDKGSPSQQALEGEELLALRPAFLQAEQADSLSFGLTKYYPAPDTTVIRDMKEGAFIVFKRSDLRGLQGISLGVGSNDKNNQYSGGRFEVRLDHPKGKLLGEVVVTPSQPSSRMVVTEVNIPLSIENQDGKWHDIYIVAKNDRFPSMAVAALDWVRFELQH